jgi:hypothetical protein
LYYFKFFLYIFALFKIISRNEPSENVFLNLTLLSRASIVGVTHEGFAPFALAQLGGVARAWARHGATYGPVAPVR